jgi:Trk K+ transport system NAD-binding subunit
VLCGLLVPDDPADAVQLAAPDDLDALQHAGNPARLVLAVADGSPRDPLARRRHPVHDALRAARDLLWNQYIGIFTLVLFVLAVTGFAMLAAAGYNPGNVIYLGIMDMTGSALTNSGDSLAEKVAQVMLTVDGMALLPLITAIIVGARLTGKVRGEPRPPGGHVIVVGGGEIGLRVIGGLHDLGFDVALIDQSDTARAVPFARRLGLAVIVGDAPRELTLRRAGLDTAIALVTATSSDIVNLETALQARSMRGEDLRIVLRLFDDDLAYRVGRTLANTVSRSVSYLAAPAFAAAMLQQRVLRTIAVGRHVLLIADVRIEPGSAIDGRPVASLEGDGLARVLAISGRGSTRFDWTPRHDRPLAPGDRLIVLATQAGLSTFLAGERPSAAHR